jgi:hypothetical protein
MAPLLNSSKYADPLTPRKGLAVIGMPVPLSRSKAICAKELIGSKNPIKRESARIFFMPQSKKKDRINPVFY